MVAFILRRLLLAIPMLIFISFISFVIIQLPPGDYVTAYVAQLRQGGEYISAVQLAGGGLSVLLVEQHVGFALAASSRYYVLESGRVTADGVGGAEQESDVRAAMAL